jgi:hypothetical protein
VAAGPFGILARVDENKLIAGVETLLGVLEILLFDASFRIVDDFQEAFGMIRSHAAPLLW